MSDRSVREKKHEYLPSEQVMAWFFKFRMHSAISAEVFPGFVQFLQHNDRVVQYLKLGGHLIPKL
jgi:hypothetical protein